MSELSREIDRGVRKQRRIGGKSISKKLIRKRNLAENLIESKNRLAMSAYDLIDRHVRLIDEELNALDAAIVSCSGTVTADDSIPLASFGAAVEGVASNEPLFCICRRTAFGEMIACDNEDCLIEWFHFPCVGMKKLPQKGTLWYCPDCTGAKKRKK